MEGQTSKAALARSLGVSRSSLYYHPRRPAKDEVLREKILAVMADNPAYGSRRSADALGMSRNPIRRIKQIYHIYPTIRRKGRYQRFQREITPSPIPNRLKERCPIQPDSVWVGDFTQLWFHGRYIYFATVLDYFTREVIAWQLGLHHTSRLVIDVLEEAKRKRGTTPQLFHSDQGSEYTSQDCMRWLLHHRVIPSNSPKGKPWTNGRQESFYSNFKLEFGKPSAHPTIEALTEALGRHIHYYNSRRIHSALHMAPRQFCEQRRYPRV